MGNTKYINANLVVENIISELKILFKPLKNIELAVNESTKDKIEKAFTYNSNRVFSKKGWEVMIKKSLCFIHTYEFSEFFLRDELLIDNSSESKINEFRKICFTVFAEKNGLFCPFFGFSYKFTTEKWSEFIIENSFSKDIKKYRLMHCFSGDKAFQKKLQTDLRKTLFNKTNNLLNVELELMNDMLNEFLDNKFKELLTN